MSLIPRQLTNQSGMVTVIAMVVVVAVTALGVTLMNLSGSELDMASAEKELEQSFYDADACLWMTGRFMRLLGDLDANGVYGIPEGDSDAPGIIYPGTTTFQDFHQMYMRGDPQDYHTPDPDTGEMTFQWDTKLGFDPAILPAVVDIRNQPPEPVPGSAANQISAGYSAGIGLGGADSGGMAEVYIIACEGRSLNDAQPRAQRRAYGRYRWIKGVPGGL